MSRKNFLFVIPRDGQKASGGINVFPVGIAYVSAYLKNKGFNVFTCNLEYVNGDSVEVALSKSIIENDIDYVGTGGLSREYLKIKEVIDISKKIKPSIVTMVGGGLMSADPVPAMELLNCDYGVYGQGEVTMYEFALAFESDNNYSTINGLLYWRDGKVVKNEERDDVSELDDLPFPDYDGFNFREYMEETSHNAIFVIASRSCPFKCTFCYHPSGGRYRKRSLDNIFAEIDSLLENYSPKHLIISDELFAPKKDRVLEFCRRIESYKLKWSAQMRVTDVDEEIISAMKASGCVNISYGIESADESILKSMVKKIKIGDVEKALSLTVKYGIEIQGGLIFGDPSETMRSARTSLDWYDKNRHYVLDLNMVHTYPGTPIYNNAVAFGIIPDKKQFLIDGCPVINISQLADEEYKFLASEIYERNIMSKFEPDSYNDIVYLDNGRAKFSYDCVRCKDTFSIVDCDVIHNTRHRCNCGQRYYFELSNNIDWSEVIDYIRAGVQNKSDIYLWGAGEVSIKIIDRLTQDTRDRITILDSSKSRHGLTLRGLPICPPDALHGGDEVGPKLVLVTVLTRKNEILKSLKDLGFKGEIVIPDLSFDRGSPRFRLKTCQNFACDDLVYAEKSGEWVPWSGNKYIQAEESAVIGK